MIDYKYIKYKLLNEDSYVVIRGIVAFVLVIACFFALECKYYIIGAEYKNSESEIINDSSHYYYNSLTYSQQQLYASMKEAISSVSDYSESVSGIIDDNGFEKTVAALVADNPQFFYLDADNVELQINRYSSRVKLAYLYDENRIEAMSSELEEAAQKALESCANDVSYDTEFAIHDYICRNVSHARDGEAQLNTAYGALITGEAYSDGYASAFKYLCDMADIYCVTYYGTLIQNGDNVAFNRIYADGTWYNVNVTLDDVELEYTDGLMFHSFLNICDADFEKTHAFSLSGNKETISGTNSYYLKCGFEADDITELKEVIKGEISYCCENNTCCIELACDFEISDYELEEAVVAGIIENGCGIFKECCRIYRLSGIDNSFTVELFYSE